LKVESSSHEIKTIRHADEVQTVARDLIIIANEYN